jgi:hypothetical protein
VLEEDVEWYKFVGRDVGGPLWWKTKDASEASAL